MGKRLSNINVENSEDNRRQYRQLLFTTEAEKLKEHISGVILFHETFYQKVNPIYNPAISWLLKSWKLSCL